MKTQDKLLVFVIAYNQEQFSTFVKNNHLSHINFKRVLSVQDICCIRSEVPLLELPDAFRNKERWSLSEVISKRGMRTKYIGEHIVLSKDGGIMLESLLQQHGFYSYQ